MSIGPEADALLAADVDVRNTSEVLFRLCANTDPQRDTIFTKGPSEVLDHATSKIASGSKLGIDATRKLPAKASNAPGHPAHRDGCCRRGEGGEIFGSSLFSEE